jgi:uncharacterized glyoxalase superfamily protein PhnB
MSAITPYLLCEDVAAQLDFLRRAFGLEEVLRYAGDDGIVNHAEMRLGDAMIYLGAPGGDYRNPARLGAATVLIAMTVSDVDAVCERARAAGAQVIEEPADQDYGERRFAARDPEGHEWFVSMPLGETEPQDRGASTPG